MKETQPHAPVRDRSLLGLPLEIRVKIYEYCLVKNHPIDIERPDLYTTRTSKDRKSLLYVSKQISAEAVDVLYGKNTFTVSIYKPWDVKFERAFTLANRQKMRSLKIAIRTGNDFEREEMESKDLWFPTIAKLATLHVEFKSPYRLTTMKYLLVARNKSFLRDEPAEWARNALKFVHQQLPSKTIVEVDDDGTKEIVEVVEKVFPGRSWKLKTTPTRDA